MEKQNYLLSILIPTRNRQKYAAACVEQIYHVTDDRTQIVIQDNSDNNSLETVIGNKQYECRVLYNYTKERLTIVDNYSMAIKMSSGEYICAIGDDDGVIRNILDIVEYAKSNGIDAIKPGMQAIYYWPGVMEKYSGGSVLIKKFSEGFHFVKPIISLKKLVQNGFQGYMNMDIVKAYHGIVARSCYEKIKEKTGFYCGGLSPDMYFSVALSTVVEKLLCVNVPFTISGICKDSYSGNSIKRKNVGSLDKDPHFIGQAYSWSDKVPPFFCGETTWADTGIHALIDMKEEKILEDFGYENLAAYCLKKSFKHRKTIIDSMRKNGGSVIRLICKYGFLISVRYIKKIKHILAIIARPVLSRVTAYQKDLVDTIISAEEIVFLNQKEIAEKLMEELKMAAGSK